MLLTASPSSALAVETTNIPAAQKADTADSFIPSAEGTGVELGDGISWPLGQVLPTFLPPEGTLDAVQMKENDRADITLLVTLQGIVNRKKPRIILFGNSNTDGDFWAKQTGVSYRLTGDRNSLIRKYLDEIEGLVVYEEFEPQDMSLPANQRLDIRSHTVNLAITYAGLHNCLAVTGEQAEALSAALGLPVVEDYRGKFKSVSTKEDTHVNKREVYQYLADNLWDDCNKRVVTDIAPGNEANIGDAAVALKSAVTWLNPGDPKDKAILDQMYPDLLSNEAYHLGWWEDEPAGVGYGTDFGVSTFASDFYENMTVHGGQSKELNPPTVPAKPKLENKLYVALGVTDGDNMQFIQHHMRDPEWWNNAAHGDFPITWTFQSGMLDAGPQVINYYYKNATDADYFICGANGLGYNLMEHWAGGKLDPADYMRKTNHYFEKTQMGMATLWNELYDYADLIAENCPSALGFTVQAPSLQTGQQLMEYIGKNEMPFLSLSPFFNYVHVDETDKILPALIDAANQQTDDAPQFLMMYASPWPPTTMSAYATAVSRIRRQFGDKVEFVRADHLIMLRQEYDGRPFNVGLRANATASGADGAATADKAVDGSFAKDKGWASSNEGAKWLQLDLGKAYSLTRYVMKNAESGYFGAANNAKAWQFQVSQDGKTWRTADTMTGNTDAITYRSLPSEVTARYVRVVVTDPGADGVARIQDIEVYGRVTEEIPDGIQYDAYNHAYYYENGEPVKNAWRTQGGVKHYFGADGIGKTGWFAVGGKWYYADNDAQVQTGWFKDKGTWYFADGAGVMATGWKKMGSWFYFGTNGKMRTGWFQVGKKWYFADSAGKMKTGWFKDKDKWYYSDSSGAMATGWKKLGSKWYYLGSDGKMRTGWYKVGSKWYYSDSSGRMKTGWFAVGKKWYFANGSGAMQTGWIRLGGKWYWLNGSGAMQTGWKKLGSKWYWFDGSGRMLAATSRKIGGKTYRFGGSGVCLNP